MNKLYFLFFTLIAISCGPAKNTNMNKTTGEGWVNLFDGLSTNGWHTYGKTGIGSAWKVENGALFFDGAAKKSGATGGDIVTNEEFENFHLSLEWKISPKGNSGIIFLINEDPAKYPNTYHTGLEMQVLDNGTPTVPGHPDAKFYTHRAGDLYDLLASKEMVKPQGEWNQVEIVVNRGRLDFFMNGEHTLTTTLWNDAWNTMVANSKFKTMPGFGTFRKGKIALQDHDDNVWYRNIRIKRL